MVKVSFSLLNVRGHAASEERDNFVLVALGASGRDCCARVPPPKAIVASTRNRTDFRNPLHSGSDENICNIESKGRRAFCDVSVDNTFAARQKKRPLGCYGKFPIGISTAASGKGDRAYEIVLILRAAADPRKTARS